MLKQTILNWRSPDEYIELCNFEIKEKIIFLTNSYNMQDSKKVPNIINWLDHEGLRLVQAFNNTEKEKCRTNVGLFEVLSENFKPQHNVTILSLQYCTLVR